MSRKPIDDLIDMPLNELTEEEAAIVIEHKAALAFEAYKAEEAYRMQKEEMKARADSYKVETEAAIDTLEQLKQRALQFYDSQGNE